MSSNYVVSLHTQALGWVSLGLFPPSNKFHFLGEAVNGKCGPWSLTFWSKLVVHSIGPGKRVEVGTKFDHTQDGLRLCRKRTVVLE